jgi:multidrug resistance efflux pump
MKKIILPEIKNTNQSGIVFISRAVSITMLILLALFIFAVIIAFTVRIDTTIDANGILEPAKVRHIHSPESGKISAIFFNSGDSVKMGDLLIQLDTAKIISEIKQYQSELATKKNNLEKKKKQIPFEKYQNDIQIEKMEASLLRSKASFRSKLIDYFPGKNPDSLVVAYVKGTHIAVDVAYADIITSEVDLKNRKSLNEMYELELYDIKNMEIEISQLQNKISELFIQQKKNKIISPIDGVVLTNDLEQLPGTYVAEGNMIMDIAPTKKWNTILFVNERDIHKIKMGNSVQIEIAALNTSDDHHLFYGKIIAIAAEPNKNKENYSAYSGLYKLTVAFEDSEIKKIDGDKLKKGYSIQGKIIKESGLIIKLLLNHLKEL